MKFSAIMGNDVNVNDIAHRRDALLAAQASSKKGGLMRQMSMFFGAQSSTNLFVSS